MCSIDSFFVSTWHCVVLPFSAAHSASAAVVAGVFASKEVEPNTNEAAIALAPNDLEGAC